MIKGIWWKFLGVALVLYTLIYGLIIEVPALPILHESIRNLFYHVTMWFAMMFLMGISFVASLRYLSGYDKIKDMYAENAAHVGMLFGVIGITTGMVWAQNTWGAFWVNDPHLNGAAITMLAYLAYFVLRGSIEDEDKKARFAAVYNIFAFVLMVLFLMVLPRYTDSLHPGKGGNPGFNAYDLDNKMRLVFYPAIIGFILIGYWLTTVRVRMNKLALKADD